MKSYHITFEVSDEVRKSLGEKFKAELSLEAESEHDARKRAMELVKAFYNTALPGIIGISQCVEVPNEFPGIEVINCRM